MRIAYLTAGAAGMYCGSCLHDNAIAKALIRRGHDAVLIPTYTPILTDEESVSSQRLFYGGLNVYLQQLSPVFRWLPNWSDQFLSSPRLVNWVASRAMGTSAKNLGGLTVSMLKGSQGRQKKEVRRLCAWLESLKPDVVVFSNLLIAGCIEDIKRQLGCPVVVMLQGDDIFYEALLEPFRSQAMVELRRLAQHVDLFLVHSQAYGQRMQAMLEFDPAQLGILPLAIDVADFENRAVPTRSESHPPTIGYLARLAPEKGLHVLVDTFIELHKSQRLPDARLEIAGWLGKQHEAYWQELREKLEAAGLAARYAYHGSVDRPGKLKFLEGLDVLCVPTTYHEPKGLFVLEGLVAGVPYVQPSVGAFPELHQRAQGGLLFDPESPGQLAERLISLLENRELSRQLGDRGRNYVLRDASMEQSAARLEGFLRSLTAKS